MDKKMYLVILQVDPQNIACSGTTPQNIIYLGTTPQKEQAFAIARDCLNQNPNIKAEQIQIEEYFFKNYLKILDSVE